MADKRNNVIKYNNKKRPVAKGVKPGTGRGTARANSNKGVVPAVQAKLRKAYKSYRRTKSAFKKNGGFDSLFRQLKSNQSMVYGTIAVVVSIILLTVVYFSVRKNSYEVFVGNKSMGIIAMSKSVTAQNVHETAVSKLATEIGSNVQVNEQVEFVPVHSSKSKHSAVDYVISNIYKSFTYKVEACVVVVNGAEITTVKSQSEAEDILMDIVKDYVPEGANILLDQSGPVEQIDYLTGIYVEQEEIDSRDQAHSKLTAQNLIKQSYTIKSGDTLWTLASNNDMKMEDIINMNPGKNLNDPTKLRPGTSIDILRPVKLISVRTIEEVKYMEVDYKKEQRIDNSDQPKSYQKVVQQGRDGQKEVTYHIVRVNGFEVEKIQISESIISPSEPYVIEVGTKN